MFAVSLHARDLGERRLVQRCRFIDEIALRYFHLRDASLVDAEPLIYCSHHCYLLNLVDIEEISYSSIRSAFNLQRQRIK